MLSASPTSRKFFLAFLMRVGVSSFRNSTPCSECAWLRSFAHKLSLMHPHALASCFRNDNVCIDESCRSPVLKETKQEFDLVLDYASLPEDIMLSMVPTFRTNIRSYNETFRVSVFGKMESERHECGRILAPAQKIVALVPDVVLFPSFERTKQE
jgi:hypothetical protein